MTVEIRDVAPGLWLWRQRHWEWTPEADWQPVVSSFVVESGGEVVLIDPLAPPPIDGLAVYERLEAKPPTAIVVVKPDHVRDVTVFAHWYGIPAHGPDLFWPGDTPPVKLEAVHPGDTTVGGLRGLFDGRSHHEVPIYAPDARALFFADGLTAQDGTLRIWWSPLLQVSVLPALRAMLELPFEWVLVSHGDPVHTRADFEAALERDAWDIPADAGG